MLMALSSHFWRPDFSPSQVQSLLADYCQDLGDCRLDEIEIAMREYRLNAANKFFPKSSQLREIVFANRKHREDLARIGEPVRGSARPVLWWTQAPYLWRSDWHKSEIPEDCRASFEARLAKKRAAGAEGWGENDFYGLERKYADQQAANQRKF